MGAATWPHAGRLPSQASLFTVSDARVHLESRYPIQRAWETNALELIEGAREVTIRDGRYVEISLGGHELKTLVLETGP